MATSCSKPVHALTILAASSNVAVARNALIQSVLVVIHAALNVHHQSLQVDLEMATSTTVWQRYQETN